jgi:hypothetical protein
MGFSRNRPRWTALRQPQWLKNPAMHCSEGQAVCASRRFNSGHSPAMIEKRTESRGA